MKQTGNYLQPFYRREKLRFRCTQCGICCGGGRDEYVFLDRDEARRICTYLGLTWRWFRRRYLRYTAEDDLVLDMRPNGECIFFRGDGCSIYPVRPRQCVTYPFWPELVRSRKRWGREARRCEGIGQGAVVPIAVIERALEGP